ncbi:MAG TPA: response regulator, partial [Patescibacteria group bacterium]|nr:response regulator [Patescibacteria group bacterium]
MALEPGANRPVASSSSADPVRVMVVDDSAVVRGLITRMLEEGPGYTVIASVGNGQMAIQALDRYDVEVVILDIEMPVMDGLTALPKLLKADPDLQIIMASTLTLKNADISMRAIEAGAADYIPKPTSSREISGASNFKMELLEKVKALAARRRRSRRGGAMPTMRAATATSPATSTVAAAPARTPIPLHPPGPITLRQPSTEAPDVIAIGSSTGGP